MFKWMRFLSALSLISCAYASPPDVIVVDGNNDESSFLDLSAGGSGSSTNTLGSLIVTNSGIADLSNSGSGSLTNTLADLEITNSGSAFFANSGSGSVSNTIDTLALSSGSLSLGGSFSTTNVSTLNWSGGEIDLQYSNGGFGVTHFENLNLTGPVILRLIDDGGSDLSPAALSGSYTLFTVDNFTGDSYNMTLASSSLFVEAFTSTAGASFISVSGNTVTLNLVAVPEPASYGLIFASIALLGLTKRRLGR